MYVMGGSRWEIKTWVPATHTEVPDGVPVSLDWSQPDATLDIADNGGVNQQMDDLALFLSLSLYYSLCVCLPSK